MRTRGRGTRRRPVRLLLLCASMALACACGDDDSSPTAPSGTGASVLTISQVSPPPGSTVTAQGTPPGAFIPRNSGQLSVPITVRSGRSVSWAQLNVYLLTADGYCGQNLPDSPTWEPFDAGQEVSYTVTGFQVYRVPCDVTGVRAMLHTRNNGNLTPPTASETVADATATASFRLRQ